MTPRTALGLKNSDRKKVCLSILVTTYYLALFSNKYINYKII